MSPFTLSDPQRWSHLIAAEERALAFLRGIEASGVIAPGRRESEVHDDITEIATRQFNIEKPWHRSLVRAGINALCVFRDRPDDLVIQENDAVFLDLGPVFSSDNQEWEADLGQTYALGADPARHALVAALPDVFEDVRAHANANPQITGAELYAFAQDAAEARGYIFGGEIAGHTLGEHPRIARKDEPNHTRIWPLNPTRLTDPDPAGHARFWIIEIHLVAPDRTFGGFYERLLRA